MNRKQLLNNNFPETFTKYDKKYFNEFKYLYTAKAFLLNFYRPYCLISLRITWHVSIYRNEIKIIFKMQHQHADI